jgi:hypothetical protein
MKNWLKKFGRRTLVVVGRHRETSGGGRKEMQTEKTGHGTIM